MAGFPGASYRSRDLGANLTIVVLLSFGLGTATLLYTAVDRLLLHPLPGIHAETLVRAAVQRPQIVSRSFSVTMYDAMQHMRSFSGVAAESDFDTSLTAAAGPERIVAGMVSAGYFSLLGVHAELGRFLIPADEQAGAGGVPAVLSHRFWLRRLGGAGSVAGKTISIQGRPFTVVGVMPEHFYGTALDSSPDLWIPFAAQALLSNKTLRDPESDRPFNIVARLREGVSMAQAEAEFAVLYKAQAEAEKEDNPGKGILEPIALGAFYLHDQFARALALLMWGLAAFLLILCANVAGLLLVRAARRERETAIRVALGASRSRIVARALMEGMGLALAGAGVGLMAAYASAPLVVRLLPSGYTPLPVSLAPDLRIDALAIALALVVSLGFGVAPAWLASHVAPQHSLRGGRSTRRVGAPGRALLSLQTGLTLILLVAAGLLIHTFQVLRSTDPGFDAEHLVSFTLDPSMAGGAAPSPLLGAELERRVRSLPGVRDAGFSTAEPMRRVGFKTSIARPGERITQGDFLNTSMNDVSSSFFDTLGIPIVAGNAFSPADAQRTNPAPAVINEAFARLFFPGENPLGMTFGQGVPGEMATATYVVVGVAGDSKYRSLREVPPPTYYAPINQREDWGSTMFLWVRTQGPPAAVIGAVRNILFKLDARLPFFDVVTMHEQIAASLWQERLLAALAAILSFAAVLMAAAGLYGLLAYDMSQRTREFGIRAAVGATKRNVAVLLLKDIARIVVPGIAAGLVACFFLARILEAALYGIHPLDPLSFATGLSLIVLIGIVASWRPVNRAMNVDPAIVLRDE